MYSFCDITEYAPRHPDSPGNPDDSSHDHHFSDITPNGNPHPSHTDCSANCYASAGCANLL